MYQANPRKTPESLFKPLTVTALNKQIKTLLEKTQGQMFIEGEVSNLARPRSGHLYFSLKDEQCQVQCVWLSYQHNPCAKTLTEGMQLLVRAKVTLYEARGTYQLLIQHAEEAGLGALQRAFEALKHRLKEQGWFDATQKKPIPKYPSTIGLVTSPSGAAIQDMLSVLKRRYACAKIIVYPCQVQGDDAAPTIIHAIQQANNQKLCDVLLLARGGGNIEDLWAFNREDVARAIFESTCPIITGVGHEIDTTIADYVADLRAPTPSAAAESATPDQNELLQLLDQETLKLTRLFERLLNQKKQQLQTLEAKCIHPTQLCQLAKERLKTIEKQLIASMTQLLNQHKNQCQKMVHRHKQTHPCHAIAQHQLQLKNQAQQLNQAMTTLLTNTKHQLAQAAKTLEVISPLHTLTRGYAIVAQDHTNQVITTGLDLQVGDPLRIQFASSQCYAEVKKITEDKLQPPED